MRNALWSSCASTPNRSKIDPREPRTAFSDANALNERPGSLWARLGSVQGALLECSWVLLARPGAPRERSWGVLSASLAVLGASRLLPEALLNRSRGALIPQDRFLIDVCSILARFWLDFGCLGHSWAHWLARFSCQREPQRLAFRLSASMLPASFELASIPACPVWYDLAANESPNA